MDTARRTKIVATLGPATDDPAVMAGMIEAGMLEAGGKRRLVAEVA